MKYSKRSIATLCRNLGIEDDIANKIIDGVKHCIDNKITHVDFVLCRDIFAPLSVKFGKTECAIESELTRGLRNGKNQKELFNKLLGYNNIPTPKKLFCLILEKYEN